MEITYLGHSSFLFRIGEIKLLFDPFITPNPRAADINVDELKPDYIVLSHGHGDHTADVERIAGSCEATIICNAEMAAYYEGKGLSRVHPMNIGGKVHFDFGTLKSVAAVHSSSFPDGTYAGNPCGYVIQSAERTFYYAGDTALTMDMKLLAEDFQIDFALLPIGDNYTMGISDAIRAAGFVNTSKIIGMHYDTFPIIEIDKLSAMLMAKRAEKELVLMEIGQTLTV